MIQIDWRIFFKWVVLTTNQLKMDPETDAGSVGLLDMLTLSIWCEMWDV